MVVIVLSEFGLLLVFWLLLSMVRELFPNMFVLLFLEWLLMLYFCAFGVLICYSFNRRGEIVSFFKTKHEFLPSSWVYFLLSNVENMGLLLICIKFSLPISNTLEFYSSSSQIMLFNSNICSFYGSTYTSTKLFEIMLICLSKNTFERISSVGED
jgi:hypothetical protein